MGVVATGSDISVVVPGEAVASEGGGVPGVAVTDGQMQCDDRVAARDVGEGMRRRNARSLGVGAVVPGEAVASESGGVASVAVTDGQMQRDNRVTTAGVGEGMRRGDGGSLIERLTIPGEAVAGESGGVTGVAVTDGQMQRDNRVTTAGVGEGMRRGDGGSLIERLTIPGEAVASESGGVASVAVTDGQMQRDNRVTTAGVSESMCRGNSGSHIERLTIPGETVAGESGGVASVAVADGQMECDDGVAARDVGEGMRRRNARSLGVGAVVPGEAVAGEGGSVPGSGVFHRQTQRHHTVAARRVGRDPRRRVAALGVGDSMPLERVAGGDGLYGVCGFAHRQLEVGDGVHRLRTVGLVAVELVISKAVHRLARNVVIHTVPSPKIAVHVVRPCLGTCVEALVADGVAVWLHRDKVINHNAVTIIAAGRSV